MRQIKFRGKTEIGEWVYGFYTQGGFINPNTGEETIRHIIDSDMLYDIDPDTLGQFTGLHDRNGKEIYEGDVVKDVGDSIYRFEVRWLSDWAQFCFIDSDGYWDNFKPYMDIEVIGNIHDNAELLKK